MENFEINEKKFVFRLIVYINAVWRVTRPLLFVFFNLALATLVLMKSDQSRDILRDIYARNLFKELAEGKFELVAYYLSLCIWSISIFFLSVVGLALVEIHNSNNSTDWASTKIERICNLGIKFLPKFLAIMPFVIFIFAFVNADKSIFAVPPLITFLIGIFMLIIYLNIETPKIDNKATNPFEKIKKLSDEDVKSHEIDFPTLLKLPLKVLFFILKLVPERIRMTVKAAYMAFQISRKENVWFNILFLSLSVLSLIFFVAVFFLGEKYNLSALSVVFLASAFWLFASIWLNVISLRYSIPILAIFLFYVWFISFWNNNHHIKLSDNSQSYGTNRITDSVYVRKWVETLLKENTSKDTLKPVDIYIISGEGGGIRAAYWTGNLLTHYDKKFPNFYRNTLAFTGVSGSSTGIFFYQGLKSLESKNIILPKDSLQLKMRELGSKDYLSPLVVGFFLPDMFQRIFPFKIEAYDRARYLEDGFVHYFDETLTDLKKGVKIDSMENYMNRDFLSICPANTFKSPIFLFNTTEVETGRKGIVSNVKLSDEYFSDVVDVLTKANSDLPFVTAATLSARFPLVTPPGLLTDSKAKCQSTHFVDGGYFENTGLHTSFQLLRLLSKLPEKLKQKIKVNIIFMKNGSTNLEIKTTQNFYEFSPLNAFINSWDRKSIPIFHDFRRVANQLFEGGRPDAVVVKYDSLYRSSNVEIPLGWSLSETARLEMNRQINVLK